MKYLKLSMHVSLPLVLGICVMLGRVQTSMEGTYSEAEGDRYAVGER